MVTIGNDGCDKWFWWHENISFLRKGRFCFAGDVPLAGIVSQRMSLISSRESLSVLNSIPISWIFCSWLDGDTDITPYVTKEIVFQKPNSMSGIKFDVEITVSRKKRLNQGVRRALLITTIVAGYARLEI